jgi:hypothetical protein
MHPELSRELFKDGVEKLTHNAVLLVERGWLILCAEYPILRIAMRHRATGLLRVFELDFADWNDQPPALRVMNAETGGDLDVSQWPKNPPTGTYWHGGNWVSPSGLLLPGRPFMCLTGIREYHTHHAHKDDGWEQYKDLDSFTLGNIVSQVSDVFQKSHVAAN